MTKKIINVGRPDRGDGDPLRVAFVKINDNFNEVYELVTQIDTLNIRLDGGAASTTYDANGLNIDGGVSNTTF
jgi:hypothetical protein